MEHISILHTNDLHSHFENWPKIRRYLQKTQSQLKKLGDTVITVDLGDAMDRWHPLTEATDGKANVQILNQIGYDAATIGNNEGINNTHEQLNQLYQAANFDVLLDDIYDEATNCQPKWAKQTKIISTKNGTKVGLFALTAPYDSTYHLQSWKTLDIFQVTQKMLARLKAKCDVIVLLSHLGIYTDQKLAEKFADIDIIIGSHTHHLLVHGQMVNQTLLAAAGKWGQYVGRIDLTLEHHQIVTKQASVSQVADMPSAAGDQAEIDGLYARGKKLLTNEKIAALPRKFVAHLEKPSPFLDVVFEAVKQKTHTKAAILNGGLLLGDLPAGVVSKADLHRLLPHAMRVVKMTLSGSDLWRLIREMEKNRFPLLKSHPRGMGFRGSVFGGLFYDNLRYDEAKDVVYFDGKPLDFTQKYQIGIVDNYIYIPYFPTLAIVGKAKIYGDGFLRDVVANYLAQKYPLPKVNPSSAAVRQNLV